MILLIYGRHCYKNSTVYITRNMKLLQNMFFLVFIGSYCIITIFAQHASKCNLPVLQTYEFIDYRYPKGSVKNSTLTNGVDFDENEKFGLIWKISTGRDNFEIGFPRSILMTSFLLCEVEGVEGENCVNMNSTFLRIHYSTVHSQLTQLRGSYFPNGDILLEEMHSIPIRVSFNPIEASFIKFSMDSSKRDRFIQLQIFGCYNLPQMLYSLNPGILHYDLQPSYDVPSPHIYIQAEAWCSKLKCNGLASTLIDGIIIYGERRNDHLINKWCNGIDKTVFINIFFNDTYKLNSLVLHGIADTMDNIPGLLVENKKVTSANYQVGSIFHSLFDLENLETSNISLKFQLKDNFTLSEIEFFGTKNIVKIESKSGFGKDMIGILLSVVFFLLTLLMVIPLTFSVVFLCFRRKKQPNYFPIPCKPQSSRPSIGNIFSSQEVIRSTDNMKPDTQTQHNNTSDCIVRLDTNALNNLYERIPTIPTTKGNELRESIKLKRPTSPLPPPPSNSIKSPLYAIPVKNTDQGKTGGNIMRPLSQDGYLQLMNSTSLDKADDVVQVDDSPMYDYVRPRSAMLPFEEDELRARQPYENTPGPEYCSVKNNTDL